MSESIHERVTQHIVSAIKTGKNGTFRLPWHKSNDGEAPILSIPRNGVTGNAYHGVNVLVLWATDFRSNIWATYKQWKGKGCQVRGGEKGTRIVYYQPFPMKDRAAGEKRSPSLKFFTVFNSEQVDGYDAVVAASSIENKPLWERIDHVENVVTATGADIRHGGDTACYCFWPLDYICMPHANQFEDTEHSTAQETYYSTLLHELTHWTGCSKRLGRDLNGSRASGAYAFEELVAELGAAFLCAELGITNEPRLDHVQYIESWLRSLESDPKHIFRAAHFASEAAALIMDTGAVVSDHGA
ncbi:MAG: zincin-like metallopeptidase domain-containing protein [Alphaproteobacteria bacterium]|nr:zincin-like metallopeptidase domain-containing protein [Alphaproteobacteria bacterium]